MLPQDDRDAIASVSGDAGPLGAAIRARLTWLQRSRRKQRPPAGDWSNWLLLAGRGFGKTRIGAEDTWWACARGGPRGEPIRHAVVAPTSADLRRVCFEGESGILSVAPAEVFAGGSADAAYNASLGEIHFANGSIVQGFSAEQPRRLRGPQFHRAWCDELAAWEYPQATWDMLQFCLRLGTRPRSIVTTTPRPLPIVAQLMADKATVLTRGSTFENRSNLAAGFFASLAKYEGTELGRQELYAELLDLYAGAILKPMWWRPWDEWGEDGKALFPSRPLLAFASVDGAYTKNEANDPTACTVWQLFRDDDTWRHKLVMRYAWQDHLELNELLKRLDDTVDHFKLGRVVIENKANGQSVAQEMRRRRPEMGVHLWNPGRSDKVARAHAAAPLLAGGFVYATASKGEDPTLGGRKLWSKELDAPLQFRPWAKDVIEQCGRFPTKGEHDDFVDSLTQAVAFVRQQGFEFFPEDDPPPPPLTARRPVY